jgi:hypothetical protein
LTGEQIAANLGEQADLPARCDPMPLSGLDGNRDQQAMFAWFACISGRLHRNT